MSVDTEQDGRTAAARADEQITPIKAKADSTEQSEDSESAENKRLEIRTTSTSARPSGGDDFVSPDCYDVSSWFRSSTRS